MKRKSVTAALLLEELAADWQLETAEEFVDLWSTHLHISAGILDSSGATLTFVTSLRDIRFRGMDDVPCIVVGGRQAKPEPPCKSLLNASLVRPASSSFSPCRRRPFGKRARVWLDLVASCSDRIGSCPS